VLDYTYEGKSKTQLSVGKDIGIALTCLAECTRLGADCMAVSLQNLRGGRQKCFAHVRSASADGVQLSQETGVTYFEKACASECQ